MSKLILHLEEEGKMKNAECGKNKKAPLARGEGEREEMEKAAADRA
jgi:hypothetical protein